VGSIQTNTPTWALTENYNCFWKNTDCSIKKKEQDPKFMLKLRRIVGMEETQKAEQEN